MYFSDKAFLYNQGIKILYVSIRLKINVTFQSHTPNKHNRDALLC